MRRELLSPCSISRHVEALAMLVDAQATLRIRGWKKTLELASNLAQKERSQRSTDPSKFPRSREDDQLIVDQIEAALWRTSRLIPGTTCIHRALAAQKMLYRRRFQTQMIIGLRKSGSKLEGHAWLEVSTDRLTAHLFWTEESGYRPLKSSLSGNISFR